MFHEYGCGIPGFNGLYHLLIARTVHGRARHAVVHKEDGIGITFAFRRLLQQLFLIRDAVGFGFQIIIPAQAAIQRRCSGLLFLPRLLQFFLLSRRQTRGFIHL